MLYAFAGRFSSHALSLAGSEKNFKSNTCIIQRVNHQLFVPELCQNGICVMTQKTRKGSNVDGGENESVPCFSKKRLSRAFWLFPTEDFLLSKSQDRDPALNGTRVLSQKIIGWILKGEDVRPIQWHVSQPAQRKQKDEGWAFDDSFFLHSIVRHIIWLQSPHDMANCLLTHQFYRNLSRFSLEYHHSSYST